MTAVSVPHERTAVKRHTHLNHTHEAFKRDAEAFLACLHDRAESLFADGYHVQPHTPHPHRGPQFATFVVINPQGVAYTVNAFSQTCQCVFSQGGLPVACKHLVGLKRLIREQAADWWQRAKQADARGDFPAGREYANKGLLLDRHWFALEERLRSIRRAG